MELVAVFILGLAVGLVLLPWLCVRAVKRGTPT